MGPHMAREGRASSPSSAAASPSTGLASGAGSGWWLAGSWPLFSLEGKHRQGLGAASPAAPGHLSASTACGLEWPSGPRLEQH